jgi:hypothetical protein
VLSLQCYPLRNHARTIPRAITAAIKLAIRGNTSSRAARFALIQLSFGPDWFPTAANALPITVMSSTTGNKDVTNVNHQKLGHFSATATTVLTIKNEHNAKPTMSTITAATPDILPNADRNRLRLPDIADLSSGQVIRTANRSTSPVLLLTPRHSDFRLTP